MYKYLRRGIPLGCLQVQTSQIESSSHESEVKDGFVLLRLNKEAELGIGSFAAFALIVFLGYPAIRKKSPFHGVFRVGHCGSQ